VEFRDDGVERVHYLRRTFTREPDFGETSRNYQMAELIARAEPPRCGRCAQGITCHVD